MVLLFILLMIILLLAVLLFTVASRLVFSFDSVTSDAHLTLFWLYPLVRSEVKREANGFVLTVYLLNKKILLKELKANPGTSRNKNLIWKLHPTDIHIRTRFGFRDPFATGLACSAISAIPRFFAVDSLRQLPDFLAPDDYINVDGTAKLNLGRSLLKIM